MCNCFSMSMRQLALFVTIFFGVFCETKSCFVEDFSDKKFRFVPLNMRQDSLTDFFAFLRSKLEIEGKIKKTQTCFANWLSLKLKWSTKKNILKLALVTILNQWSIHSRDFHKPIFLFEKNIDFQWKVSCFPLLHRKFNFSLD